MEREHKAPLEIVLLTPEPTREYGEPEAIGPFNQGFAQDYIENCIEIGDGWTASVIVLENPSA